MRTTTADAARTNFMDAVTKLAKELEPGIPDGIIVDYVMTVDTTINLRYNIAASSLSLVVVAAVAAINAKDFKEATRRGDALKRMLDFILSEEMYTQLHKDLAAKKALVSGHLDLHGTTH